MHSLYKKLNLAFDKYDTYLFVNTYHISPSSTTCTNNVTGEESTFEQKYDSDRNIMLSGKSL